MASKSEIELQRHEITFRSRCIDMKRFAYDVIKYSVLKLGIPESLIAVWEGPDNDYVYSDFCLVFFRRIFQAEILKRHEWHQYFRKRFQSNQLESFNLIARLFRDIIKKYTACPLEEIEEVEISLAVACELVLFLHSKKMNLYLKHLAEYWFDCYMNLVKKEFQTLGGLGLMYLNGMTTDGQKKIHDVFNDKFISEHCLPYENSVEIRNLGQLHDQLTSKYYRTIAKYFLDKQSEEIDDIFVHEYSSEGQNREYKIIMLPVTSKPYEHSKTQFEEFLLTHGDWVADALLPQIFLGVRPRDQPQNSTVHSAE